MTEAVLSKPNITAYKFANGEITNQYIIGPYSSEMLINDIHELSLVSFNVEEAMQAAIKQGPKHGADGGTIIKLHGNRYKISYSFEGVEFNYVEMNPKLSIKRADKHNQDIKKFKDLINLFALYYGLEAIRL